jgi:hypothetical protein
VLFRPPRLLGRGILGVSLLALAGFLVVGCAGFQERNAPPVAGNFVGEAVPSATQHAYVAVIASSAEEGEDEREVKAYLCDGGDVSEWFRGEAGNTLDLTSENGAHLEGNVAAEAATGTITLSDGTSFSFTANQATGPAGLYNASISPGGSVSGTSETGGRIEGQISEEADSEGLQAFSGTVTPAEGRPVDFAVRANDDSPGDVRIIVSEDVHVVGAGSRFGDGTALKVGHGCNRIGASPHA